MAAAYPMLKKRKTALPKKTVEYPVKYPDISIFIVERKIQRVRLDHIKNLARKKGFPVSETLNESITHIVSELETRDEVLDVLRGRQSHEIVQSLCKEAEIVSMEWFTTCMEEGLPVPVTHGHRLKVEAKVTTITSLPSVLMTCYQDAKYSCQRITPLNHHNKMFTDALEILEKHADFLGGDNNASRALAFRKASAALKALPRPVRSMNEVDNLCDLKGGRHCKRVVQEILEEGFSSEIEDILNDVWFQTMKLFTGIFGCGAATSRKWYDMNLRSLEDIRNCPEVNLTTEQRYGLDFYDDINTPVTRHEAEVIQQIVEAEAEQILPGATVTVTGGFSRGKGTGHDVDLLISHPVEGKEEGLLAQILNALHKKNFLAYTDVQNSSYSEAAMRQIKRSQVMDHFERCFSIFRLPRHLTRDDGKLSTDGHKEEQTDPSKSPHERTTARTILPLDVAYRDTENFPQETLERDQSNSNRSTAGKNASTESRHVGTSSGRKQILRVDLEAGTLRDGGRNWVARRVDLIITPQSQYAFALMGWIGSRMFNRSIRDYANREMNMTLTSHGLFDKTKGTFIDGEVFKPGLPPSKESPDLLCNPLFQKLAQCVAECHWHLIKWGRISVQRYRIAHHWSAFALTDDLLALNTTVNALISAKTQREIFEHLKLEYREPEERNC